MQMKLTISPHVVVPSGLVIAGADTMGPRIAAIINTSSATSIVPECLKHECSQPLLRKPNLKELPH